MTGPSSQTHRLLEALDDYLRLRRAMGYSLARAEKLLRQFIEFLTAGDHLTITVEDTLAWVKLPAGASPSWVGFRMTVARGFLTYLHTLDPDVRVPPAGLLPGTTRRSVPYLYSDADIGVLLAQAQRLRTSLRVSTISTLICLLSVTGLRVGEAIGLDDDDLDPVTGLLLVRQAKGGRHRLVPLHPSTVAALSSYQHQRDTTFGPRHGDPRTNVQEQALLVSSVGTRLGYENVSWTFTKLVRRGGLTARAGSRNPCLHDLRHTFAVHTLLDWYRDGGDIPARLPLLSTYLGHAEPAHTYWYLQAAPELMAEAAVRLEAADTRPGRR
jgi:integrase